MPKRIVAYIAIAGLLATAAGARAGSLWEPLGDGPGDPDNQYVTSLIEWNGQLYALLNGTLGFDEIAAWDGTQWNPVGGGLYVAGVYYTIHDDMLTLEGIRTEGDPSELLTWDGNAWASVVPMLFDADGAGNVLASYQGKLYAGDSYYSPTTGSYWGRLWLLGGSGWEHERWFEAEESYGGVNIVTVLGNTLYVHVYSYSAPLYAYDGTTWTQHSTTYLQHAKDLVLVNGDLYLGGDDSIGDSYVLRWDGVSWVWIRALGFSYGTMLEFDKKLALGAGFGYPSAGVEVWDGSAWTRLPGVMNDQIRAMAVYDGDLVAAGLFTEIDGVPVPGIARYVGQITPVAISRLTAHRERGGVRLDWEIHADEGFSGFDIYRDSGGGAETRINTGPIPADARSFIDAGVVPGVTYSYVLVAVGAESGEVRSQRVSVEIPALAAALEQNVPNPFNPTTTIGFSVAEYRDVRIDVFDASGAFVRTLVDAPYDPGEWTVEWDGTGATGARVASGVYYYRMQLGNQHFSKKMVLLK